MKTAKRIFKQKDYPEIYESSTLAHLFGRYSGIKQLDRARKFGDDEIPDAFGDAIEFFMAKEVITKEEFKKLQKTMRKKAFTIAKLEDKTIISRIKESLDSSFEKDMNLTDWIDDLNLMFDKIGITQLQPHYLELVFKNAANEALNEGKLKIYQEADEEEFPFLEFVAIEDSRVRPEHLKLNGFRAPKSDPIWQKLRPPLDHGCRCTLRPVHADEGLKATKKKPKLTGAGFKFVN